MKRRFQKLREILLYGGISREQYLLVRDDATRSNAKSLKLYSSLAFLVLVSLMIAVSILPGYREVRGLYFVTMLLMGLLRGAMQWFAPMKKNVLIGVYAFILIMGLFTISLGLFWPNEVSVSFIVFLLAVPLLYMERPIRMILCFWLFVLAFIIATALRKPPSVMVTDILDALVFGAIGAVLSTYMMIVKYERLAYIHEISVLSETDLLTKLRNRNSFERNLPDYPQRSKTSLCCIYIDVNGLHELNNARGHEAGDRMLQCVAEALRKQFGDKDVYRIGGDEFVAFVLDVTEQEVQNRMDAFMQEIRANGYSLAMGMALQDAATLQLDDLCKKAEAQMYAEKRNYYQQLGGAECGSTRRRYE